MTDLFRLFVNQHQLFTRDQKILLAVSGGIDSVVMAHLFAFHKLDFGLAHCNFSLRGDASDGDQHFVQQLAAQLGYPFYSVQFNTKQYALNHGLSTQMAARELRYRWFEETRQQHDYHLIATAHHADDDAETFFINLMRGTGLRGLQAIPLRQGVVIRPLKFADRNMIATWAELQKITWREDATNAQTNYLRNKIRHQLLPLIEEISPGFGPKLSATIDRLADTTVAMEKMVEQHSHELITTTHHGFLIDVAGLRQLHPTRFWLFELLRPFGFNAVTLHSIEQSLERPDGQVFLSATHYGSLRANHLFIASRKGEEHAQSFDITTPEDFLNLPHPMSCKFVAPDQLSEKPQSLTEAWFDADCMVFPLTLRRWQKGDRFHPFGLKGSKKVSDYFTDQKFTPEQKSNTWLLCSNNQIAWVVGHRTDDRFRITANTKLVLTIRIAKE